MLLSRPPKPLGIAKESRITWETSLHGCIRKSLRRMLPWTSNTHKCCAQELGLLLGTVREPGRGRRPGLSGLRCRSCSVSRRSLEVAKDPAQWKVQSQPADLCQVHSSVLGATVFCLLSWCFFSPNFKYHFALESRLQIFPLQMPSWGMFLSTAEGGLQLGRTGPLLWHSLLRHPLSFSTKCLLFYSCHHL